MYITIGSLGDTRYTVENASLPKKPERPVSFTLTTTPPNDPALSGIVSLNADDEMHLADFNIEDYLRYELNPLSSPSEEGEEEEASGRCVLLLTNEEIVEPPEPVEPDPAEVLAAAKSSKKAEMRSTKDALVENGVDVETTYGTEHFPLRSADITYMTAIYSMLQTNTSGATEFPYHSYSENNVDTNICVSYSIEDWTKIATTAFSFITYHETYLNMLMQWIDRETDVNVVNGITYGCDLPEDLGTYMLMVLGSAAEVLPTNPTTPTEPGSGIEEGSGEAGTETPTPTEPEPDKDGSGESIDTGSEGVSSETDSDSEDEGSEPAQTEPSGEEEAEPEA